MDKVAIVILNWNGEKFLKQFLPALITNTPNKINGESVSIIVADNNSKDNSIKWLKDNYSQIRVIELDKNYGFTGGYNRALAKIEAEYYILLNSDILTPKNWLQPLISFLDNNSKVGIVQPKMLSYSRYLKTLSNPELKQQFEYAGACGGYIDKHGFPFCRGRILSNIEEDNGQYNTPTQVFWASGACMVVRSSLWRELNGLDEVFFAHMEEIDFCWRAQLHNQEVWAVPESAVYHVGGGTLPNNSPKKLELNYRNNLLMLYKNLPDKNCKWKIFKRMSIDGLTAIIYLLQFKFSFFKAVIKAHSEYRALIKKAAVTKTNNRCQNTPFGIYQKSLLLSILLRREIILPK